MDVVGKHKHLYTRCNADSVNNTLLIAKTNNSIVVPKK